MFYKDVGSSAANWLRVFCLVCGAATGQAVATTTINHQFSPATINQGDASSYTITIANDVSVPLASANVTVVLPAQVVIANPLVSVNGCGFTGVTSLPGTSTVELTGGTIPAKVGGVDGQCAFQVTVTSSVPGSHVATIPANTTPGPATSGYEALENGVTVSNGTLANATLVVTALSPPTGVKVFSPSPGIAGDPITLTITLTNPNAGVTMPLTSFTDTLPAGMVVASPANASTSCGGAGAVNGVVAATPGSGTITLTGGVIGQGGTCTISARVVAPSVTGISQVFTNSVLAGEIGNTRGLTSPAFSRDETVNSPIGVGKSISPASVPAGQPALMTITLANASTANPLAITNFDDDLTGTTLTLLGTASAPVAAPSNPAVTCTGTGANNGTLSAPVDTANVTINLAGATAGPLGNCTITAYVTSTTDGLHTNSIPPNAVQNPSNHDSPAASANLTANAQLTVDKTVSLNQVAPGQWTTFTVTVNNWSGGPVGNVSFTDSLPLNGTDQMVLDESGGPNPVSSVGCAGGTWAGGDGDSALTWVNGTVAAGSGSTPGTCTIVFRARLPATATTGLSFANQIPSNGVTGIGNGPGGPGTAVVNPNASPAVNVTTVDSVEVTKSFSPGSIAQGGVSTLTLRVRNRTVSGLTAVNLTDTLPAGLTLAANPATTNTCGGTPQAFPGDNKIVLTAGTVSARPAASTQAECVITAQVTGSTLGTHTNSIAPGDFSSSAGTIPGAVSANLAITTGLTGSKSFSPTSATSGGVARVTIHVSNTSSGALSGVAINDSNFSTGLTVANPANAATSCGGSPTLVVNPGAGSAQLLGASLPAGAGCDFSFDVITSGAGPWSNTVPIGGISSAEGPANSAAVSANLAAATASISINKAFNPVIVTGGLPSLLTIDVINSAAIAINQAGFTDTFPNGIEIYSVPNASTNCPGGTVSAVPGDGKVSLAGATLAPNSVCQVYVTTTSVKFLNLTNTIPAGAISSAQGYTNALGTTATLSTLQGLGVMKGFDPAYIGPGQTARLKIRLVSTFDPNAVSPVTLTGVSFTDALPAGMLFAAPANAATTCAGGTLTVNAGTQALTISGGNLAPGTTCDIEVDVTAPLGGYNNVIPAFQIVTDQGVTNQSPGSASLTVVDAPTLAKAFSPATVRLGQASTLTVTLTNNAAVPLTGVALTDILPVGVTVHAVPAASTNCAGGMVSALAGDNEIRLSGATIPASASCTFRADVVGNVSGPLTNTIGAGAIGGDQGVSNPGPANATLTVLGPPTIGKVFSPVSIASGGVSTLILSLANANPADITLSADLVDALPGNMFVANPPGIGGTCPGGATAVAGATSITYANGASIPAGGCTIRVDVTSSVSGVHLNTIAAGQLRTSAGDNPAPTVATLGVDVPAPPTLDKDFTPSTIDVNGSSTLTLTLGNPNGVDLTLNALFQDTLPAGLVLANPASVGGSCPGVVTAVAGGNSVDYANGATLPAGGCTITVPVTSGTAGGYINTLAAGALSTTTAGGNILPAVAALVVRAPTPPSVTKAFGQGTINPGGVSRLTLTLENANPAPITLSADFVDTLPANLSVAGTPNIGGTCPGAVSAPALGGTITYANGSSIPAGGCTIQVDVSAAIPGGPYLNNIPANALQTDVGNNGAPAVAGLFVNPTQPPSVSKSFSPAVIPAGGVATLSISLGNGNAIGTTLTADLVDTLPPNMVVANPPAIQASAGCGLASVVAVAGGGTVIYQSGGGIPPGGCAIAVNVTSATVASYTNTIAAGQLQTGFGVNAVGSSAPLQVLAQPTVAKSFAPATILAGASATLTLTLGNANAATALTLTQALTDTLPAGLVLANPATIGGSCAPGSVSALAGGTTVSYASGAVLPAAGGCTITVPVTAASGGGYVNTIPAGALRTSGGNNAAPASATLTVLTTPTLAKVFSPASISPGGQSTLTLALGNGNAAPATLTADLVDTLPAGMTLNLVAPVGGSCNLGQVARTATTVSYASGATIPAGGCTIVVAVTSATVGTHVNTIPAGSLQTDAGTHGAAATAQLTVNVVSIPTLSEWSMLVLTLLIILAAARMRGMRVF